MSKVNFSEEERSPALRRPLAAIRDCEESGESMKGYADRRSQIEIAFRSIRSCHGRGLLREVTA